MSPVGTSRRYRNVRFSGARRGSADISQRLPRVWPGAGYSTGVRTSATMPSCGAKLDVAAYGLVLAVSGGGQEQSPGRSPDARLAVVASPPKLSATRMRSRPSSRVKRRRSRRHARSHSDQAKGLSARAAARCRVGRARCRLPLAARYMGRQHHAARQADAHGARRLGRVRALADGCAHQRWQEARQGSRRAVRPTAQAHPHQRQEAIRRLSAGETQTDIARSFNVHHTTIGRLTTTFRARRGRPVRRRD